MNDLEWYPVANDLKNTTYNLTYERKVYINEDLISMWEKRSSGARTFHNCLPSVDFTAAFRK